jgi:hypothetical protein
MQWKRKNADPDADDWYCSSCSARCFGSKSSCFKCGVSRDGTSSGSQHRRREGLYTPSVAAVPCVDQTLTCKDCAEEFVSTAKEQAFFRSKGFLNGTRVRCSACAKKKKASGQNTAAAADRRPTSGGRLICRDFLAGTCTRGAACKFTHGAADGVLGDKPHEAAAKGDEAVGEEGEEEGEALPTKKSRAEVKMEAKAKKAKQRAKLELGEAGAGKRQHAARNIELDEVDGAADAAEA